MREFNASVLWASWTISIYYIGVTMALPLVGSLSDGFGRRRVFLLSLALFTAGSLLCGLAPNIGTSSRAGSSRASAGRRFSPPHPGS